MYQPIPPVLLRGWQNTVGNLIEIFWLKNNYRGPQFNGTRVKHRGVRFHRIRDLKQYYFNSIPPTSQLYPTHAYRTVPLAAAF